MSVLVSYSLIAYEAKDVFKPKKCVKFKDSVKPKQFCEKKASFKDEAKAKHEQAFWKIQEKYKKAKFIDLFSGPAYFNPDVLEVTDFDYDAYAVQASIAGYIEAEDTTHIKPEAIEVTYTKLEASSRAFSVIKVAEQIS